MNFLFAIEQFFSQPDLIYRTRFVSDIPSFPGVETFAGSSPSANALVQDDEGRDLQSASPPAKTLLRRRRSNVSAPSTSTDGTPANKSESLNNSRRNSMESRLPTVEETEQPDTSPSLKTPVITLSSPQKSPLQRRRTIERSMSVPMEATQDDVPLKEVDRPSLLRRGSSSLEMTFSSGLLAVDGQRQRPTILKREGSSSESTPLPSSPVNFQEKDLARQFSHEKSAALIANQRRLSAIIFEADEDEIPKKTKTEESPSSKLKRLPSVNEKTVAASVEEQTPYIPKVALAKRKFLVSRILCTSFICF